jgi:hypothetical protein
VSISCAVAAPLFCLFFSSWKFFQKGKTKNRTVGNDEGSMSRAKFPKIQNLMDEIMPARSYSAVFSRWRWVFFFFSFRRLMYLYFLKKRNLTPSQKSIAP